MHCSCVFTIHQSQFLGSLARGSTRSLSVGGAAELPSTPREMELLELFGE